MYFFAQNKPVIFRWFFDAWHRKTVIWGLDAGCNNRGKINLLKILFWWGREEWERKKRKKVRPYLYILRNNFKSNPPPPTPFHPHTPNSSIHFFYYPLRFVLWLTCCVSLSRPAGQHWNPLKYCGKAFVRVFVAFSGKICWIYTKQTMWIHSNFFSGSALRGFRIIKNKLKKSSFMLGHGGRRSKNGSLRVNYEIDGL